MVVEYVHTATPQKKNGPALQHRAVFTSELLLPSRQIRWRRAAYERFGIAQARKITTVIRRLGRVHRAQA
jgi:hypothetical protein